MYIILMTRILDTSFLSPSRILVESENKESPSRHKTSFKRRRTSHDAVIASKWRYVLAGKLLILLILALHRALHFYFVVRKDFHVFPSAQKSLLVLIFLYAAIYSSLDVFQVI